MVSMALEVAAWAEQQFGGCELGDKRRTQRVIKLATQAAMKPDASTPEQTESWGDCKAAYRLFAQAQVTFEALIAPHCALTHASAVDTCLVLNDTTEINFGSERQLTGVGRVGSSQSRGFFLHTALVVHAESAALVGLAAQDLYTRPLRKVPRVSSVRRKTRARETDVWGRVIDRVGPPAAGVRWIHVCDRGADNFEIYCHLLQQHADWVIRAAQLQRTVFDGTVFDGTTLDGERRAWSLHELLQQQPCLGTYELQVQANGKQSARTALIEVRCTPVIMPRPTTGLSAYVRKSGIQEIGMWAVEAREVQPPRGTKALRWVLLTSEPVQTFDDAWRVLSWYERRQLIEEYHKCLKTGCRVEARQYQSGERLAPVIGLLSVLAMRLLQLKTIARTNPEQAAAGIVPTDWLKALPKLLKRPRKLTTIREFIHGLASLGGFLARKSDGEPGWQTIWSGLSTLLLCLRGAAALQN